MKLFNKQRGSMGSPNGEMDMNLYQIAPVGNQRSSIESKKSFVESGTTDYTSTNFSNKLNQGGYENLKR